MHVIRPCTDAVALRQYIDRYWLKDHILARNPQVFAFQYQTPWVDRSLFPHGISVLCAYDGPTMIGFIGVIAAPYPRDRSSWLALWHVVPELKGGGLGGRLLESMQECAIGANGDGWIGTFGAGPEALPVYLKRGYACRAVRRWLYADDATTSTRHEIEMLPMTIGEREPSAEWLRYRFEQHPVFQYERRSTAIFRSEQNSWGAVTHVLTLNRDWRANVAEVFERERRAAELAGMRYLMDAWAYDCPGPGWRLAATDVPSVFHPPEARGNLIYASGRPFLPHSIQKGDCDQDRPN